MESTATPSANGISAGSRRSAPAWATPIGTTRIAATSTPARRPGRHGRRRRAGRRGCQRPAHAGAEGIGGADQVERLGAVAQRQQQPDAEHRQADPEEVQQAPRGEDRHQQRPGELQSHRDAQRHGAHREIEQQVHAAQGDAVDHHRAQRLQAQALAPGTQEQQQDQRGEEQPQGRGALGADQGNMLFARRRRSGSRPWRSIAGRPATAFRRGRGRWRSWKRSGSGKQPDGLRETGCAL